MKFDSILIALGVLAAVQAGALGSELKEDSLVREIPIGTKIFLTVTNTLHAEDLETEYHYQNGRLADTGQVVGQRDKNIDEKIPYVTITGGYGIDRSGSRPKMRAVFPSSISVAAFHRSIQYMYVPADYPNSYAIPIEKYADLVNGGWLFRPLSELKTALLGNPLTAMDGNWVSMEPSLPPLRMEDASLGGGARIFVNAPLGTESEPTIGDLLRSAGCAVRIENVPSRCD